MAVGPDTPKRGRDMDWDKLRVFHAVAEAGSFTHAGHELGLSQSAVSRQIATLENDLHAPLFHRHARGLILTEQGELLFRTATDIFARLANVRTRLIDTREKPTGELRVTTTAGLGSAWLTPRIAEFIELYPSISVILLLEDAELDLAMREADVAIRLRQPVQPDLIQRKLFTVHQHIYAAPDYIRQHGLPESLADLDDHKLITFTSSPGYLSDINWLETAGCTSQTKRPSVLKVNSVSAQRAAVEAGLGIASLPDYIVGSHSNLIQLQIDADWPEFDTYLVYAEELRQSKRVAVFNSFIAAKAREWKY